MPLPPELGFLLEEVDLSLFAANPIQLGVESPGFAFKWNCVCGLERVEPAKAFWQSTSKSS